MKYTLHFYYLHIKIKYDIDIIDRFLAVVRIIIEYAYLVLKILNLVLDYNRMKLLNKYYIKIEIIRILEIIFIIVKLII